MNVKIPIIDADEKQAVELAMRIARRRDELEEQKKKSPVIIA